jgi:hypothetical protein
MNGVEITPRVDSVAAWHDTRLSLAATGTAGERRTIPNRARSVEAKMAILSSRSRRAVQGSAVTRGPSSSIHPRWRPSSP